MPAISYKDVPIYFSTGGNFTPPILAQNVSIQYQNKLRPNRVLNSSQSTQFEGYGIDGAIDASISLAFYADTHTSSAKYCLETFTGNIPGILQIGGNEFKKCYLNSATVNIQPFAPVVINADFVCYEPVINANFQTDSFPSTTNYTQKIVYGHSVTLAGGTLLSETTRDSITYSVSCARTPRYSIGSINTDKVFLDSLEKDISIKSTNINKFIDYQGYDDTITIGLKDETGANALSSDIQFSAARIISQSLSASEGDTLVVEIKAKEVIL